MSPTHPTGKRTNKFGGCKVVFCVFLVTGQDAPHLTCRCVFELGLASLTQTFNVFLLGSWSIVCGAKSEAPFGSDIILPNIGLNLQSLKEHIWFWNSPKYKTCNRTTQPELLHPHLTSSRNNMVGFSVDSCGYQKKQQQTWSFSFDTFLLGPNIFGYHLATATELL